MANPMNLSDEMLQALYAGMGGDPLAGVQMGAEGLEMPMPGMDQATGEDTGMDLSSMMEQEAVSEDTPAAPQTSTEPVVSESAIDPYTAQEPTPEEAATASFSRRLPRIGGVEASEQMYSDATTGQSSRLIDAILQALGQ